MGPFLIERRWAANQALHLTAIPLRFMAAGGLTCWRMNGAAMNEGN
jgi:hypothetical protein